MKTTIKRPDFANIESGTEFNNWYWLKEEMVDICINYGWPSTGRKFELRDRIMYALDNDGRIKPTPKNKVMVSKFNWAKSALTLETEITDNVSFGPNFRGFMKSKLGNRFSCHSDFMDWVKTNEGKTLKDAILKWIELEDRKKDVSFKRKISAHNMYAQYTRDFLEDNSGKTIKDAREHWLLKKQLPTKDGFVRYERSDLNLED